MYVFGNPELNFPAECVSLLKETLDPINTPKISFYKSKQILFIINVIKAILQSTPPQKNMSTSRVVKRMEHQPDEMEVETITHIFFNYEEQCKSNKKQTLRFVCVSSNTTRAHWFRLLTTLILLKIYIERGRRRKLSNLGERKRKAGNLINKIVVYKTIRLLLCALPLLSFAAITIMHGYGSFCEVSDSIMLQPVMA